eukprot:89205_1
MIAKKESTSEADGEQIKEMDTLDTPNTMPHRPHSPFQGSQCVRDIPFTASLRPAEDFQKPTATHVTATYIGQLEDRFQGFKDGLIAEREKRIAEQTQRLDALRTSIGLLRKAVTKANEERVNATRALQTKLSNDVHTWRTSLETPLYERLTIVESELDKLVDKLGALRVRVEESRAMFPKQIEERANAILVKLNDFTETFDAGQKVREKEEEKIFERISAVGVAFSGLIREEEKARAEKIEKISIEVSANSHARESIDVEIRAEAEKGLTEIHKLLKAENEARENNQKIIIEQIKTYTNRLRSAVHSVS